MNDSYLPIHNIKEGDMIRVKGIYPKSNSFNVNLVNGPNHTLFDVPLHIKVAANALTCHTRIDGAWMNQQSFPNPAASGPTFEYLILADTTHFKLAVNGKHVGDYEYKLPLSTATHLNVHSHTELTSVSFESGAASKTTYSWVLNRGIKEGDVIRLKGIIPEGSNSVGINFQNGSVYKMWDIPFAVRYLQNNDVVVCKTYNNGEWLNEQTHVLSNICSKFDIEICFQASQFKLTVNGKRVCNFHPNIPVTSITHLTVTKDVKIISMSIEKASA